MTDTQTDFSVGDRVHMEIDGHWLYGDVVDVLPDSSMVVTGYMSKWARRVWPEHVRKVCKVCLYCKSLNEKPKCAY